jgi:hypothetical protein
MGGQRAPGLLRSRDGPQRSACPAPGPRIRGLYHVDRTHDSLDWIRIPRAVARLRRSRTEQSWFRCRASAASTIDTPGKLLRKLAVRQPEAGRRKLPRCCPCCLLTRFMACLSGWTSSGNCLRYPRANRVLPKPPFRTCCNSRKTIPRPARFDSGDGHQLEYGPNQSAASGCWRRRNFEHFDLARAKPLGPFDRADCGSHRHGPLGSDFRQAEPSGL